MPPKSKSIFRQPGTKHFQLVHRSQRDPLINDPEAGQHVLKAFERDNIKKGKSREELEDILGDELSSERPNAGEATLYGVYYDDTEYDYMQHLRTAGLQEDGVESVLLEAPSASKSKRQNKKAVSILDLPADSLPPTYELPRTYDSQQAVPESISGLQPDMDPHLRQVLEALEDDAFVDNGLEDDFFHDLVAEGERASDEELDFDFEEEEEEEEVDELDEEPREETWEDRFKTFKKEHNTEQSYDSDDDLASEGGDTVRSLLSISVIGGKKRRKGSSVASGYSMSSSSMTRHEGLQTLDEQFEQMMLKQYGDEEGDEEPRPDSEDDESDEAPELITSRDDFDGMISEFLNDYEILGRKLRPKLEGETGAEKLDTFRRAIGRDTDVTALEDDDSEENQFQYIEEEVKKDRWDCETVLSTYSNFENHPRLIRAIDSRPKSVPKIVLDPKTGLPSVESSSPLNQARERRVAKPRKSTLSNSEDSDESDSDTDTIEYRRAAVSRPRSETKEEKKARKAAVKVAKQTRRVEKKTTQTQFDAELRDQKQKLVGMQAKTRKL
ncbi:Low temperature viability protein [Coprinopsis marcescibilis]|uniref:Low temperature viability protein n=1 Tax=Coprinopsis marcescibilis TaxID=230819 RepID=A0A5C3KBB4_COPMA|nr:Low temperature viability protein [Coprinopsis marcescibilis]